MNALHDRTEVLDQVLELAVLLNEDMTKGLAEYGLTPARTHLLWRLHHDGPATQRVLAESLKVTPRNVTGLVDGLVATGHVTREPHPTDRRATHVSLTARGASAMEEMDRAHREFAELLFGELSARQLRGFAGGLEHVLSRLREGIAAAGDEGGERGRAA